MVFLHYFNKFLKFLIFVINNKTGEIDRVEGHLGCLHHFCFFCIKSWSQYTNSCPLCKNEFISITKKKQGNFSEIISIKPKKLEFEEEDETDDDFSGIA